MSLGARCSVLVVVLVLAHTAACAAATGDAIGHRHTVLGRSVEGRPIVAIETGDFDARRRVLVVGCIHGNETAGIAIANRLAHIAPPPELDLWVVPVLNPDGVAADTRGNAHDVDLNRNFPWHWQRLRGLFYSGPRPLSEPESRIAARLIRRARPQISIWFHQHMRLVDESGGSVAIERRYAELVELPLARLAREPGGVVGWENHILPHTTAFVVELPAGPLPPPAIRRYTDAVATISR